MFTLKIETGNAAMCEPEHVASALHEIAREVAEDGREGRIRDGNGNTVGEWSLDWINSGADPEARHVAELEAIGFDGDFAELREIEARAHKAADDYCNVEGFDFEAARESVEADVAEMFGGETPAGFFVNGDPRGAALKLESGTGSLSQRDWGDFELLAPDFS